MRSILTPLLLGSALGISACVEEPAEVEADMAATEPAMEPGPMGDIVAVAQENPDLSSLVIAVTAAGLGERLATGGPYTLFAPTNEAFDTLPDGTLDELTMPENQEQLAGIVTYHLLEGETMAAALAEAVSTSGGEAALTTLNGATLTAANDDAGNLVLSDAAGGTATVTQTDIDASNGVVHVIDGVLMPS